MDTNDPNAFLTPPVETADDASDEQARRGRRRRMVLFVLLLIVFAVVMSRPSAAPAGWSGDFDAAMAQAKASGKLVVVAFHGEYCPPCHAMDRFVLGKAPIREALVDFVPVRLDPTKHAELAAKYDVYATPTYVVLTADGTLVHKVVGPRTVDEFVAFLQTSLGLANTNTIN